MVASYEIPNPPPTKPKRFVGSKGGAGVAQWLISLMPSHRIYVEAFLGRGVIMRTKLPASENIGIEIDGDTLSEFDVMHWQDNPFDLQTVNGDALTILPAAQLPADALVYCDPPYLGTVRLDTNRRYYKHDAMSPEWHAQFLDVVTALRCMVIVSGYESELYNTRLAGWRTAYKWTVNRAGARVKEFVWLNFEEPALLHDSRFVGGNYTKRQQVKRKAERWRKNFEAMPPGERWAIYDVLSAVVDAAPPALLVKDEPKQKELV